jgi:aryl-alcohol dehydrogenase-like predicted oxidoreductase
METRTLGNSDMKITRLGFGAWAIGGGGWQYSWGPQDDRQSVAAIHRALDRGMNWIDTAAVYGLGHSEEVVAQAMTGLGGRKKPFIFTKCSNVWNEKREITQSLKRDSIRKECEESLRRLRVDVIDLYQVHQSSPDEDIEEGWTAMAELKQQGKVRWIGVSNFNVQQMKRAQAIAAITSVQPPYSMLRRGIEAEILPFCEQNMIGVIIYAAMLSGMLTGGMTKERAANLPPDDWRNRNPEFQEPKLSRNLALVEVLRDIGARHGASVGEAAIAWVLKNRAITGAIIGARSPEQVEGIAGAADFGLEPEEVDQIEKFIETNVAVA